MPQHSSLTLVFCLALLVFASIAHASSHLHSNNNHKRLMKKRASPQLFPNPISPSPSVTHLDPSPSTTDTATLTPTPPPLIFGPSTPPADSTSLASSSSLSSSSTLSSATTTSSVTSTSTSTTSSASLSSSSTSSPSTTLPAGSAQTLTQTATLSSSSAAASASPQQTGGSSSSQKTTTTVLIVIAASVGGIAIIWTLFRKWKLGRSSRFDERLQPIDWQPPTEGDGRNQAHSAHGSDHGHGASSDHGHGDQLPPLPDHDFTPLPANPFAAGSTYADLAREHTPRPQMQEAYAGHNPVIARPAYDVNVPLHHQAGYSGHDGYDYTQYHGTHMRY